ncbi:MAG TPA: hypothetical protein VIL95_03180, partial [Bacillota bacterium]
VDLIGVILGGSSAGAVAANMGELMDWGFSAFAPRVLLDTDAVVTVGSGEEAIQVRPTEPVTALLPREEAVDREAVTVAPAGQRLTVYYRGEPVGEVAFEPVPTGQVDSAQTDDAAATTATTVVAWTQAALKALLAGGLTVGAFGFWLRRRRRRARRWRFARPWPGG